MREGQVLILGGKGMLGIQLSKVFGDQSVGWQRQDCDVTDFKSLKLKIENFKPSVIINCVAYNDVDGAETNPQQAFILNSEVPDSLSKICKSLNIPIVHFSTNYVFDGEKATYNESDQPNPLSVYANSKYEGEKKIQKNTDKFYIVRTALLFGPKGQSQSSKKSFVDIMLDLSQKPDPIKVVSDQINSLTYTVDLAGQVKLLLRQRLPYGVYHITNSGQASWYEFAKEIFSITDKKIEIIPVKSSEFPRAAKRPEKAVLLNTKLPNLRNWQDSLKDYLNNKA